MGSPKTAYIGIDPGVNKKSPGAAALLVDDGFIAFYDWKSSETAASTLNRWNDKYFILGVSIERVSSWKKTASGYKEGYTSKLIENFGIWQGLSWGICRPDLFRPQEWQKIIPGFIRGKPKDRSIEAALLFFPEVKDQIFLKKHSGRSDALLIAEYGKRLDTIRRGNEAFKRKYGGQSYG